MRTEAQKRADEKWRKEKIERITFRVPKGKRDLIQRCAEINGESVNSLLNRLTDAEIKSRLK